MKQVPTFAMSFASKLAQQITYTAPAVPCQAGVLNVPFSHPLKSPDMKLHAKDQVGTGGTSCECSQPTEHAGFVPTWWLARNERVPGGRPFGGFWESEGSTPIAKSDHLGSTSKRFHCTSGCGLGRQSICRHFEVTYCKPIVCDGLIPCSLGYGYWRPHVKGWYSL